MTPDLHREKAERIERSLAKCSCDDYEAVIEGAMLAGTHWFNIVLHRLGIASPAEDALHAQYLNGAQRLKLSLLRPDVLEALDAIEISRPGFVRGDMAGGPAVARQCLERLTILRTAAMS